jgi:hypothetical protein
MEAKNQDPGGRLFDNMSKQKFSASNKHYKKKRRRRRRRRRKKEKEKEEEEEEEEKKKKEKEKGFCVVSMLRIFLNITIRVTCED